jgi:hypothetical protein
MSQSMVAENRDLVGPLLPLRSGSGAVVKDKNYQYSEESSYVGSEEFEYQTKRQSKVNFDVDSDNAGNLEDDDLRNSRGSEKRSDLVNQHEQNVK